MPLRRLDPERVDGYQQLLLTEELPEGKVILDQESLGQRDGGRHPRADGISRI